MVNLMPLLGEVSFIFVSIVCHVCRQATTEHEDLSKIRFFHDSFLIF